MDKSKILTFIKEHNKEHGGSLVSKIGFIKHFPDMYIEFEKTHFPSFMDEYPFKQKLWHFLHDDYEERVCGCGGKIKFRSFWYGYNDYCRTNCPSMIKHQVECVVEKYNSKSDEEKKEISNKVTNTFMSKYGVKRFSQLPQWKEMTIQSNQKQFGKDWYTQTDEYKESYQDFCERTYGEGIKNSFQSEEVKSIINKKFFEHFLKKHPDVIEIKYNTYVCKCPDETCTLCDEKIYEIDKVTYSNRLCKGIDTCIIRNGYGNITSGSENQLFNFISSIYSGEIIKNDRSILNGKELDIYLPELGLAFEFNGVYWHSEMFKPKKYHQDKVLTCKSKNIRLIQIWEDDWMYNQDVVKDVIKSKLNLNKVNIGARTCEIKEVSNKVAYDFLQKYHIQGGVKNGKNIGLYHNGELVEVMTFGQLRKNMGGKPVDGHYEIYRLCSKSDYNVQGGFGKLMKWFENIYNPIEVITYANLDYSYGNVYEKVGFEMEHISQPTYTWVIDNHRKHRSNFRKSKLIECEKNPELTECEVMYGRGHWRCWDSGKIKFVKKY